MSGGLAREKAMRKGAFHEVAPDTLMGASLSSGKDSSSSLRKTNCSIITQLGMGSADMATDEGGGCKRRAGAAIRRLSNPETRRSTR